MKHLAASVLLLLSLRAPASIDDDHIDISFLNDGSALVEFVEGGAVACSITVKAQDVKSIREATSSKQTLLNRIFEKAKTAREEKSCPKQK